jgi:hypothetical protein
MGRSGRRATRGNRGGFGRSIRRWTRFWRWWRHEGANRRRGRTCAGGFPQAVDHRPQVARSAACDLPHRCDLRAIGRHRARPLRVPGITPLPVAALRRTVTILFKKYGIDCRCRSGVDCGDKCQFRGAYWAEAGDGVWTSCPQVAGDVDKVLVPEKAIHMVSPTPLKLPTREAAALPCTYTRLSTMPGGYPPISASYPQNVWIRWRIRG